MSARRDPRRKSFFDTPSSLRASTQDNSDGEDFAIPRRKKRTRRVSVGASTVFTTDDGFQYRRRQTLIHPKAPVDDADPPARSQTSPQNDNLEQPGSVRCRRSPRSIGSSANKNASEGHVTPESNASFAKRLSDSAKFKKIPKKSLDDSAGISSKDAYPAYPDTSEWSPTMPDNDESSAEVKLLNFLKQLVSFEICQASCVYLKDEHKFILDRIESVCKGFLAKANETVVKILDETGSLKKPKTLPNPANDALREKLKMWKEIIADSEAELASWNELKDRPLLPEGVMEEPDCKVDEYLQQQNLQHLLEHVEYHEPILKGFLSISVKADNIYKSAQASSQVLAEATKTQEHIAKWVTQRSLKPMQKVVDPQAALLNVISSKII